MTRYLKWAEVLILAMIAIALLVAVISSTNANLQQRIFDSAQLKERADTVRIVLLIYAMLFTILALASATVMRRHGSTLSQQVFSSISREISTITQWLAKVASWREFALWLSAVAAIGLTVRGYFMAQPMRYDEAFTFLNFVNRDFYHLFNYPLPNNHVFHTLLVRASVFVFGNHPVAIRLPALLAGVLVIPSSFLLTKLLLRGRGGFIASALAAVFPFLVLYDTMARGYSMVTLLSLWLAIAGLLFASNPTTASCFLMSLITALGIFTMPSFLFPAAGVILWVGLLLLNRKRGLKHVFRLLIMPFGAMTIVLGWLFYTPTIVVSNGINSIVRKSAVASMSWRDFLYSLPAHFSETFTCFIRDVPIVMLVAMPLLILAGLLAASRKQSWEVLLLYPALAIGAFIVLFVQHNTPFPRTWIFFLPFLFVLVDAGCLVLGKKIPSGYSPLLRSALLIVVGFWAVILMSHNVIATYPDTGLFPEAQVVADFLSKEMGPEDDLKVNCPANAPLYFYLWYKGIPSTSWHPYTYRQKQFFVVKPSSYSLSNLTADKAQKILALADAEVYVRNISDK